MFEGTFSLDAAHIISVHLSAKMTNYWLEHLQIKDNGSNLNINILDTD